MIIECPGCGYIWMRDYLDSWDLVECPQCGVKELGIDFIVLHMRII